MKRTISVLLVVLSVISVFAGCGGGDSGATIPEAVKTNVAKPVTMADLDAIPIMNPDMTVAELRKICVDFMRYQNSIPWTPSKQFDYMNGEKPNSWPVGSVVGGMPYIGVASGSLYNFMHFYDERNGMLDIDAIEALKQPMAEVIANQCSGSTLWAWSRVCNSTTGIYSTHMLGPNNYLPLPLGTNYVDPEQAQFNYPVLIDTAQVCIDHGEQTMYKGYAELQPADGLVHYLGERGGHVMMASSNAVIVYKEDGTIDGNQSYVKILDQTFTKHTTVQSNGVRIDTLGNVDKKYSFKKLVDDGYLPFTLPEFAGLDPVEKSEVTSSHTKDTMSVEDYKALKIKSNYAISYATVTVKDAKGKELLSQHIYTCEMLVYEFKPYIDSFIIDINQLLELANAKNTIEITARIGTGEVLTVFSGKFVPNQ